MLENVTTAAPVLVVTTPATINTVTFCRLASFYYQKPALRGLVRFESGN